MWRKSIPSTFFHVALCVDGTIRNDGGDRGSKRRMRIQKTRDNANASASRLPEGMAKPDVLAVNATGRCTKRGPSHTRLRGLRVRSTELSLILNASLLDSTVMVAPMRVFVKARASYSLGPQTKFDLPCEILLIAAIVWNALLKSTKKKHIANVTVSWWLRIHHWICSLTYP